MELQPGIKCTPEQILDAFNAVKANKADYDKRMNGALSAFAPSFSLIYTVFRVKGRKTRKVYGRFWITPDGGYTTDKKTAKMVWEEARNTHLTRLNNVAKLVGLKEIKHGN